MSFMEGKNF